MGVCAGTASRTEYCAMRRIRARIPNPVGGIAEVSSPGEPKSAPVAQAATGAYPFFATRDELRPFLALSREGSLYDVERWIADRKPLQLDPDVIRKGYRPPSPLEVAIETGQHSLAFLLLRSGYRLDLERHKPNWIPSWRSRCGQQRPLKRPFPWAPPSKSPDTGASVARGGACGAC
jgi:hypothetical protein